MRKLAVFNMISQDGYFVDANGDMSWAHSDGSNDGEFNEFVQNNAEHGGELLFARKTYHFMISNLPTPAAKIAFAMCSFYENENSAARMFVKIACWQF